MFTGSHLLGISRRPFTFRRHWGHAAPRPLPQQPRVPCVVNQNSFLSEKEQLQSTWDQMRLLQSQMDMAVEQENYKEAARARDQLKLLKEGLPPVWQYVCAQLEVLAKGSPEEQVQALRTLGEAGDESVLPELSRYLGVQDLAEPASEAMWAIFMRCKDPQVNELMQAGLAALSAHDLQQALDAFDQIVRMAPSYAEGYNKRATVLYLQQRYQESIDDCKMVMELNPWHFGAVSGMGLCHVNLGQKEQAVEAFELALKINPGLETIAMYLNQLRKEGL